MLLNRAAKKTLIATTPGKMNCWKSIWGPPAPPVRGPIAPERPLPRTKRKITGMAMEPMMRVGFRHQASSSRFQMT